VAPFSGGKTVWFELDGEGGGRGGLSGAGDLAVLLADLAPGGPTRTGGGRGAVARGTAPPGLALVRPLPRAQAPLPPDVCRVPSVPAA
jgi:hypothetical protein